MPVYYFHSQTDRRFTDTVGSEMADLETALAEAVGYCGDLMRDAAARFRSGLRWTVTVTDAEGFVLHEVGVESASWRHTA